MKKIILTSLLALSCSLSFAADKVLFTIKNGSVVKEYKDSDLKKFKWVAFKTSSPWFPQAKTFNGPLLKDILNDVGIKQTDNLTVTALDKYQVNIPAGDAWKENVILTREIDGQKLKVKDKGPAWIVYNFDAKTSLKQDTYYSRCPWQIATIEKK